MSEIGRIKKTEKLVVLVKIIEFKGNRYVDARNHFLNDKGEWIATKKGIAVRLDQLSEFITLMEKAEAQIKKAALPQPQGATP